jgi:hypothetical protein
MFFIAYFDQSPCDARRFASITATEKAFKADAEDYFASESALVYACESEDMWTEAERFAGVGCPFDCPDFRLSLGPRGGVVRERC